MHKNTKMFLGAFVAVRIIKVASDVRKFNREAQAERDKIEANTEAQIEIIRRAKDMAIDMIKRGEIRSTQDAVDTFKFNQQVIQDGLI